VARLQVIDGDPDEAARLRGWFTAYPDWSLQRDGRHWRLSDGRRVKTCNSWGELLGELERAERNRRGGPPRLYDQLDEILLRLRERDC
jgi:hypothetical protein